VAVLATGAHAPADGVRGFEDMDGPAGLLEAVGDREPGDARTHHGDVEVRKHELVLA
jgi:hypothetical protein